MLLHNGRDSAGSNSSYKLEVRQIKLRGSLALQPTIDLVSTV